MAVKVKVIGLNILRKNLERNIVLHQSKVRKAVSECGDVGVLEAVRRAPKDEGMLEESIAKELGVTAEGQVARVMVPVNAPGRRLCNRNALKINTARRKIPGKTGKRRRGGRQKISHTRSQSGETDI